MSFDIGGAFKSLINPMTLAQLAMGPAGWASLALKAIISAVGQQVIQQIGQQLGLPQQVIDVAKGVFASAMGGNGLAMSPTDTVANLAKDAGMSAVEQGGLDRMVQDAVRKLVDSIVGSDEFKNARAGAKGGAGRAAATGAASGAGATDGAQAGGASGAQSPSGIGDGIDGQSWMMQIATILGRLADKKMGEMAGLAKQIGATENGKDQNKVTELTGQMQAKGQEFGLISNAMTNVVKSLGENLSQIARKG